MREFTDMDQTCNCLWKNGMIRIRALDCEVHDHGEELLTARVVIHYVGFGGKTRKIVANTDLGYGVFRAPEYGFRRAVWDFCHGYVSGFRLRDILYFIATRSFKKN